MEIRILRPDDLDLVLNVRPGLFDNPVDLAQARAFLGSDLHRMVVAIKGGDILGFASGTVLLHPDKAPSMFINEVGTREEFQRQGIATAVTAALIDAARAMGCDGVWLGTEPDNDPALGLYRKLKGTEQTIAGFAWDGAFDPD
ncbi:GNAT family N-acetyltransferase [Loktanella sp. IMCC34160]|uniref:GNAT family N-acetyltransferase n=1 Tax=Loktanella sp. IMCC34160 TaxID=2510646 RepID=UPI0013EC999E|nr:GNAT family N-acetyltransferase [Loktanella sp. IMCC34160]